jgi:hypothetical protein
MEAAGWPRQTRGLDCAPTVNSEGGLVTHNRHVQMANAVGVTMDTLYDTRTVAPLDRYEYYRASATSELVPVTIHGRPPSQLLAMMSGAKIGDFILEVVTWAADSEAVRQRNERLIRVSDPESYRIFLSATPGVRTEQADHRVKLGARDIVFYDLSRPVQALEDDVSDDTSTDGGGHADLPASAGAHWRRHAPAARWHRHAAAPSGHSLVAQFRA